MLAVEWMTCGVMFKSCRIGCWICPTNCKKDVITPKVIVPW